MHLKPFTLRRSLFGCVSLLIGIAIVIAAAPAYAVTEEDIASLQLDGPASTTAAPRDDSAGEPPSVAQLAIRLTLSLGAVFALMALALWAAKKYMPKSALPGLRGGPIELLGQRVLGQRRSLLLVRVQGKTVLLGATPQAISMLTELDEPETAWNDVATRAGIEDLVDEPAGTFARGTTGLEDRSS